jgi:BON domain
VTFRSRFWLAAALGVCVAHSPLALAAAPPAEPQRLGFHAGEALPAATSQNQQTADIIAGQLRQNAELHGYDVSVAFQNGVARLTGTVADLPQREEVLRIVQGVPGVERVLDRMTAAGGVATVRLEEPPLVPIVPPPTPEPPAGRRNDGPLNGAPPGALPGGPGSEPVPVFQAPAPSPYDLNPPRMPPYAWPTYAPYNNYSRVAYPLDYPYNAFPFIGPNYPFPKVPLGWRSVKLEFDDGYWWFSKTATKYNWWHLRYW